MRSRRPERSPWVYLHALIERSIERELDGDVLVDFRKEELFFSVMFLAP
jgi:hypothetical protein